MGSNFLQDFLKFLFDIPMVKHAGDNLLSTIRPKLSVFGQAVWFVLNPVPERVKLSSLTNGLPLVVGDHFLPRVPLKAKAEVLMKLWRAHQFMHPLRWHVLPEVRGHQV